MRKRMFKWQGSKAQVVEQIGPMIASRLDGKKAIAIPFLGSGEVFWWLLDNGHVEGRDVYLFDTCEPLIDFWQVVEAGGQELANMVRLIDAHFITEAKTGRKFYRDLERDRFNARDKRQAREITAASFYYLLLSGFNGLWRVNRSGGMNVPAGTAKRPHNYLHLMRAHRLMAESGARITIACAPFEVSIPPLTDALGEQLLVYCDPPYLKSKHVAYTEGFAEWQAKKGAKAHHNLIAMGLDSARLDGSAFVVSNSMEAWGLFKGWDRVVVTGQRSASSTNPARKMTDEMIAFIGG